MPNASQAFIRARKRLNAKERKDKFEKHKFHKCRKLA